MSLTFGLFIQVSDLGLQGPLVFFNVFWEDKAIHKETDI